MAKTEPAIPQTAGLLAPAISPALSSRPRAVSFRAARPSQRRSRMGFSPISLFSPTDPSRRTVWFLSSTVYTTDRRLST